MTGVLLKACWMGRILSASFMRRASYPPVILLTESPSCQTRRPGLGKVNGRISSEESSSVQSEDLRLEPRQHDAWMRRARSTAQMIAKRTLMMMTIRIQLDRPLSTLATEMAVGFSEKENPPALSSSSAWVVLIESIKWISKLAMMVLSELLL